VIKVRIKERFEYCDHDPQETTCPNCGECVVCTCDCERANVKVGEKIMVAINEDTTIEAVITGEGENTLTVRAVDDDFHGYGQMEIDRYDKYWWKP